MEVGGRGRAKGGERAREVRGEREVEGRDGEG